MSCCTTIMKDITNCLRTLINNGTNKGNAWENAYAKSATKNFHPDVALREMQKHGLKDERPMISNICTGNAKEYFQGGKASIRLPLTESGYKITGQRFKIHEHFGIPACI